MLENKDRYLTAEQLNSLLKDDFSSIKTLDASFSMPGMIPGAEDIFQTKRLPGAQFFDIDKAADPENHLPHMMPSEEIFAEYVGSLGIDNNDHVVIYGQTNIAMGPCRALWMFEAFGHDKVSLLNASLKYWEASGYEIETSSTNTPETKAFKAILKERELAKIKQVEDSLNQENIIILDARPYERFTGKIEEPRPGLRAGHIPGSYNLPAADLIDPQTGGLKSHEDIEAIIKPLIDSKCDNVITTCGSGVTACVLREALKISGIQDIQVYDGSWSEWGHEDSGTKVEKI